MKIMVLWAGVAAVVATTGAFAADAYIEADGTQAIVTDYYPNPATKIVADYAYTAVTPTQMAVFGCEGNLVVRHYINGSGGYAFAFRDSSGDWLPVVPSGQLTATTDRRSQFQQRRADAPFDHGRRYDRKRERDRDERTELLRGGRVHERLPAPDGQADARFRHDGVGA